MPVMLTVHDSQYPSRHAEQLRHGLRAKKLSSKFLYDSPAQAQRWLTYHQAYSPSRTESNLLALYEQAFQTALQRLSSTSLHHVSLGCGGGVKDVRLLQQAVSQGKILSFTPMDISAALVIETMLRVQRTIPDLRSFPLVVDLEVQPDLSTLLAQQEAPNTERLLTCFGMIPNFDYQTFLPYIRRLMRPTDMLLLSANLSPTPYPDAGSRILPQYDNPQARAWFTGLLDSLGFSASDTDLFIQAHPLALDGHVWQIRAEARLRRPVQLTLYEESFEFHAEDRLHLFFSNRFTSHVMPRILEAAGLSVVRTFLFDSQEEGIYLCRSSAATKE